MGLRTDLELLVEGIEAQVLERRRVGRRADDERRLREDQRPAEAN